MATSGRIVEGKVGKIEKRDGTVAEFRPEKITTAIFKASRAVGKADRGEAERLSSKVVRRVHNLFGKERIPSVENVQDIVENVLIDEGLADIAKAYILYREKRSRKREEKKRVLEKDKIDDVDKRFDLNALRVLKARYLRKDAKGHLKERPKQLFTRVAVHSSLPDLLYDQSIFDEEGRQETHPDETFDPSEWAGNVSIGEYALNRYHLEGLKRMYDRLNEEGKARISWTRLLSSLQAGEYDGYQDRIETFYDLMVQKKFLPNTPAIANFGNPLGMGSACFVMDIEDSMESIMETLKQTSLVFKAGGGMGYNFSKLRPEGDFVSTTSGVASGPVSFMRLFDTMTEVIKQGGIRRGANMGMLNINHPDIEKFIKAKEGNKALRNFNISVVILPDFWEYYDKGEMYPLRNPRTGEVVKEVDPQRLFDMIVYQAWESAEPGVAFYDRINEYNPFYEHLGPIVTTNPCGEVLLYPNEPCNLGSINVWAFLEENADGETSVDWEGLEETVREATRFLDNVIDVNKWPLDDIEEMALSTRKIGLGIMGLGDLLYEMEVPYDSEEGREFMERLMEFINYHSKKESILLAKEREPMPFLDKSFYPDGDLPFSGFYDEDSWTMDWTEVSEGVKKHGIRNGYTTVIAPTGSISMIAGCSGGMEPVYSLAYEKNVKVGSFYYVDPAFEKVLKKHGLYSTDLVEKIVSEGEGRLQNVDEVPQHLKDVLVTALDISPEDHIRALASFQKWVDSSISKTNNFPASATVEDMRESYLLAYELGCKDVTVFRDTSIDDQVLVAGEKSEEEEEKPQEAESVEMRVEADGGVPASERQ